VRKVQDLHFELITQLQQESKQKDEKILQLRCELQEINQKVSQLQCEVKENNHKINQLQLDATEKDNKIEHLTKEVYQNIEGVIEATGGRYDYLLGKATVRLKSMNQAGGFLKVLGKTKYIFELDIEMGWVHTESDLIALEKVLSSSSTTVLRLDIKQLKINDKTNTTYTHHDIILNILRNSKMKTVNIVLSLEFIGYSTLKSTSKVSKI
jgi:outer membrane murein-binding lipoprotein Lpp